MPPLLAQALKHVPVAMVTAIVVPAVVFTMPGELRLDAGNAKLTRCHMEVMAVGVGDSLRAVGNLGARCRTWL